MKNTEKCLCSSQRPFVSARKYIEVQLTHIDGTKLWEMDWVGENSGGGRYEKILAKNKTWIVGRGTGGKTSELYCHLKYLNFFCQFFNGQRMNRSYKESDI